MKQIEVKPGIIILSSWYNTVEAAAHCGMARSTFTEKARKGGLPSGGDSDNRRYQAEDLDKWIANGFRFPGTEEALPGKARKYRSRFAAPTGEFQGFVNPHSGKVYGGPVNANKA